MPPSSGSDGLCANEASWRERPRTQSLRLSARNLFYIVQTFLGPPRGMKSYNSATLASPGIRRITQMSAIRDLLAALPPRCLTHKMRLMPGLCRMIRLYGKTPTTGKEAVSEENKAVARRFLEAQARGDTETLDELMAEDFVDRSLLPAQKPGREDYKRSLADMLSVFSNTGFAVE